MSRIELETSIAAPPERYFDLSLSIYLYLDSTADTGERVVGGNADGVLGAGDEVTLEARYLGFRHKLSMRLSAYDRPRLFRDELVRGPFRRIVHDHVFEPAAGGTRMLDVFDFASRLPPLDVLVLAPHLRRILVRRNAAITNASARSRAARGGCPSNSLLLGFPSRQPKAAG